MSGLDIFKHREDPNNFYGVFYSIDLENAIFTIYLARSSNGLDDWISISTIQGSAYNPKVWVSPDTNDIILAYESNPGYNHN